MSTWQRREVFNWSNFIQILLPPTCVLCGRAGQWGLDLCQHCQDSLPALASPCVVCALPLPTPATPRSDRCGRCLLRPPPVTRTLAALAYQQPVTRLVGQFKYQRRLPAGRVLGQLLLQQVRQQYTPAQLPQLLIPVPLHPKRLRQRGYNQAQLLAQDLGQALQIPLGLDLVQRTRATPAQQGLGARERRRNLRGAFSTTPAWQQRGCTRVALVDDVVTTMSTVREVAALLQANSATALEVHVWCVARA